MVSVPWSYKHACSVESDMISRMKSAACSKQVIGLRINDKYLMIVFMIVILGCAQASFGSRIILVGLP